MQSLEFYIYILSSIVILILFYISVYKSSEEKTTSFSFFVLNSFFYVFGFAIEQASTNPIQVYLATVIQYMGIPFVPVFLLFVICEFADRPIKKKWIRAILFIVPVIALLLVITYPLNLIYYKNIAFSFYPDKYGVEIEGSIYHTILFLYVYSLFIYSYIIVAWAYIKGDAAFRKKIFFIIVGTPTPLIILLMYILNNTFYKADFLPVVIIYICVYFEYNIVVKYPFFSINFVRTNVLDDMRDGYILVDYNNNYLDSNNVAKKIFPNFIDLEMGTPLSSLKNIPKVLLSQDGDIDKELKIKLDDGTVKYFSLKKSTVIHKKQGEICSWLLHDITENMIVLNDLEFMANYDSLTGIFNRTTFFKKCNDLFYEDTNARIPFSIMMIDIDYFKKVNDTYGHIYGDKTIVEVINRIKSNLRKEDVLARYGGEEFVIYLEDVTEEVAEVIGEKLRKAVAAEPFIIDDKIFNVTISIGISIYNVEKHGSIDDILASADKLLYKAKNSGRNKIATGC